MLRHLLFTLIALTAHLANLQLRPAPPRRHMAAEFAPVKGSEQFVFGYRMMFADTLWLRAIQNLDQCRFTDDSEQIPLSAPIDFQASDRMGQLLGSERKPAKCHLGWVYQMIDRVTDADPRFYVPYVAGATNLSVIVGDREGAKRIFDKGLSQFPRDWNLAYRAAYHYLYEIGDIERAAELLNKSGQLGAPWWVFSLAARLYTKRGQAELAKGVLEESLKQVREESSRQHLVRRLKEIDEVLSETERQPASR